MCRGGGGGVRCKWPLHAGGGERACGIRFPLHLVCPWCEAQPSLASFSPPPAPSLPTTAQPLQGALEGKGTVGFVSPIFHTGDGWPRQEAGGPDRRQATPQTRCSQRSRGGTLQRPWSSPVLLSSAKSFGVSLLLTSISLLLAGSTPRCRDPDLIALPQGVANSHAYWVLASDLVARCGTLFPSRSPAFTQPQPITRWRT